MAFIMKDKQDVIEVVKRVDDKGNFNHALKLLVKARKSTSDDESLK